jgi:hypothetical protein
VFPALFTQGSTVRDSDTESTAMTMRRGAIALAAIIGCAQAHAAATLVSDLGWLAGNWVGTLPGGTLYESHYTGPEGGLIVGASKETPAGKEASADFEVIYEDGGRIYYQRYPGGVKSRDRFPLVAFESLARRAVFENRDHDFPQVFIFEQPGPDQLRITLEGPGKDGAPKQIVFALGRAL